jgi:AcrR family transcriptional regulator
MTTMKTGARLRRPYRMTTRAENRASTQARILSSTLRLFRERWIEDITFQDVADTAGVGLQTVIRHFGSRAQLVRAAAQQAHRDVLSRRFPATPGDIEAAIDSLVDHYERDGDQVLRALAQEDRIPELRPFLDAGRDAHRLWVQTVFGPRLTWGAGARSARLAELAAVTDVYVWKLLRKDHRLAVADYQRAVTQLVECVISTQEKS